MQENTTIAAVDLGSNSFRLQLGRVADDQFYPLDSLREAVRLGAGLTPEKRLDEAAQSRAIDALKRFGERLRERFIAWKSEDHAHLITPVAQRRPL